MSIIRISFDTVSVMHKNCIDVYLSNPASRMDYSDANRPTKASESNEF